MKKSIVSLAIVAMLAGCIDPLQPKSEMKISFTQSGGDLEEAGGAAGKTTDLAGHNLSNLSIEDLKQVNFALEDHYERMAVSFDQINHAANSVLILSAFSIALNTAAKVSGHVIERHITTAIGFNEAVRYAQPNVVASALRKSSRDALCLAQEAGKVENKDNKTDLVVAMRISKRNLRARVTRPTVSFVAYLDLFNKEREALKIEDTVNLENRLEVAKADPKAQGIYKCLN